jgi:sec-independent protein translocase protein TatB
VFNIQGSEMIFLLLIALIVLGPEKLPDAIRKFGRAYSEFKKMANGFQGELRDALDEPMRELRETADAMKSAADFDLGGILNGTSTTPSAAAPAPAPACAGASAASFARFFDCASTAERTSRSSWLPGYSIRPSRSRGGTVVRYA